MEDLAVTAMGKIFAELLERRYDAAESALDAGELEGFLVKAVVGAAQDVRYDAATSQLTVAFSSATP
jgi:hypothetical protein